MGKQDTLSIYGPKMWYIIHTFSARFKNINCYDFERFFYLIEKLFPCNLCRVHIPKNLLKLPLRKNMVEGQLLKWSYQFHKLVNETKNCTSPSYAEVYDFYFKDAQSQARESILFDYILHILFTFTSFGATKADITQFIIICRNFIKEPYVSIINDCLIANDSLSCFDWLYQFYCCTCKKRGVNKYSLNVMKKYFNIRVCESCKV